MGVLAIFKLFQSLDTDRGEFICPVCRQMANALLPVPPDAQELPPAIIQNNLEMKAAIIQGLLGEETFHMVSDDDCTGVLSEINGKLCHSFGGEVIFFLNILWLPP